MPEHFTRNTVMASVWCSRCGKPTMHRIDGVKRGPCIVCMDTAAQYLLLPQTPAAEQVELFSDALVRDKRGD